MGNMVMNNKLKNFRKNAQKVYRPIVANRDTLPFLRTGTTAACFHRVGK
jgi:hypothetical protein